MDINIHNLLINFILDNKIKFLIYLLFTIVEYPVHYIYVPEYYGKVINSFKDNKQSLFVFYIKVLTFLYVLEWVSDGVIMLAMYYIVPKFTEYATGTIFEFIIDNYELDFENIPVGEILSKTIRLPGILFDYIDIIKNEVMKYIFVVIGGFMHYYGISKRILILYSVFIIINYIYIYIMYKKFNVYEMKSNKYQDEMYESLIDCLNNLATIYTFNQKDYEKNRFYTKTFVDYKDIMSKSRALYMKGNSLWGVIILCIFISLNYVLYDTYKLKQINSEKLVSTFIITFSIIRVIEMSERSSHSVSRIHSQIKDAELYFNKISKTNTNIYKNPNKKFKNGDIVFQNIYHKYTTSFVLDNVSIQIKKGEKIAFVGDIGSGKSTMVKLLLGFQPLSMGTITIGGVDINSISNTEIRDYIFYIPQKPKLFNRSLYENIVYGLKKPPSKEAIVNMLNDFELNDIANDFKEKMDEKMGIEGNKISGGQRQIVWLLRSLYRPSHILVLDEPTAALDPENKEKLIHIIKKLSVGKTVIIVSHDKIDESFRRVEFKDGKVVNNSYF
uniref:ABC transporter domain-containing protein n=1 Tax=viral metagenome TaxID=1070528 RepID=A0A6C0JJK7_9ZZZZ